MPAQAIQVKRSKWNYIKLRSLYTAKGQVRKLAARGGGSSAQDTTRRGRIPGLTMSCTHSPQQHKQAWEDTVKRMSRNFPKEQIKMSHIGKKKKLSSYLGATHNGSGILNATAPCHGLLDKFENIKYQTKERIEVIIRKYSLKKNQRK